MKNQALAVENNKLITQINELEAYIKLLTDSHDFAMKGWISELKKKLKDLSELNYYKDILDDSGIPYQPFEIAAEQEQSNCKIITFIKANS